MLPTARALGPNGKAISAKRRDSACTLPGRVILLTERRSSLVVYAPMKSELSSPRQRGLGGKRSFPMREERFRLTSILLTYVGFRHRITRIGMLLSSKAGI